jgi:hypothetical protein
MRRCTRRNAKRVETPTTDHRRVDEAVTSPRLGYVLRRGRGYSTGLFQGSASFDMCIVRCANTDLKSKPWPPTDLERGRGVANRRQVGSAGLGRGGLGYGATRTQTSALLRGLGADLVRFFALVLAHFRAGAGAGACRSRSGCGRWSLPPSRRDRWPASRPLAADAATSQRRRMTLGTSSLGQVDVSDGDKGQYGSFKAKLTNAKPPVLVHQSRQGGRCSGAVHGLAAQLG